MTLARRERNHFRQLTIESIQNLEDKKYHMAALSIVTRMYLTKVVKDAIIRGLKRSFSTNEYTDLELTEISNHIMDEMGKDTEKMLEIVKQFFVKSED